MVDLANALRKNTSLVWLNLSYNPIGDNGIKELFNGLIANKKLQ